MAKGAQKGGATRMTAEALESFLQTERTLTLVTLRSDGAPVAHPMWFAKVGDKVYVNTRSDSLKYRNVRGDDRVCAVVESGESYLELRGVRIEGRCTPVEDPDEIARVAAAQRAKDQRIGSGLADLPEWFSENRADRLARGGRVLLGISMDHVFSWDFSRVREHYARTAKAGPRGEA